jgi:hypothetical protein
MPQPVLVELEKREEEGSTGQDAAGGRVGETRWFPTVIPRMARFIFRSLSLECSSMLEQCSSARYKLNTY